jgi:hypothetical protein
MTPIDSNVSAIGEAHDANTQASTPLPIVTPLLRPQPNPPTLRKLKTDRKGSHINDLTIQVAALNKSMDFMGIDLWDFTQNSGKRYKWRAEIVDKAHSWLTLKFAG